MIILWFSWLSVIALYTLTRVVCCYKNNVKLEAFTLKSQLETFTPFVKIYTHFLGKWNWTNFFIFIAMVCYTEITFHGVLFLYFNRLIKEKNIHKNIPQLLCLDIKCVILPWATLYIYRENFFFRNLKAWSIEFAFTFLSL